ncbi:MAG TPA: N-acetylmuramoyl-L-alanine amidase [Acidobacteriaceae bacterium]|nr:N-acetylmuramoyl-L-alanine amidase [Acidobacteriaceae bacterium]
MRWTEAVVLGLAVWGSVLAQSAPQTQPAQQASPVPSAQANTGQFVVVIDAAHGGTDAGAGLGNGLAEKNVTLALSVRLRSTLQARGVNVVTTREADATLPALNRAEAANHAQAAVCLVLHATATGSGVHLYTAALAPAAQTHPLSWPTAQAGYVTQSVKLESEIDSAMAHAQIPVTLGRASVQPMDNLACPAVAVEMAPLVAGHITGGKGISDTGYQETVVNALAAAVESWRSDWKQP